MKYIATVMANRPSMRGDGSWNSYVGENKDAVVRSALLAKAEYERNGFGPYDVLVGVLDEKAIITNYRLEPLSRY